MIMKNSPLMISSKKWLILAALFAACQQPTHEEEATTAGSEKIATELFIYFNDHNWNKMSELYKNPATFLDPSFGTEPVEQTRVHIAAKYAEMQKMFPDIRDSVVSIYASGNHVTIEFISSGTGKDGKKFMLPITSVLTVENGQITEDHTYYDNSGNP